MRRYLDGWARQLVRRGVRSGLIEGSNVWLSIGAIAWLFRLLAKRPPPQVSVERLRLGESLTVSHVPAPPRSRHAKRKAARKVAKLEQRLACKQARREASRRYARARTKAAQTEGAAETNKARKQARSRRDRRPRRVDRPVVRRRSKGEEEEPA